MYRLLLFCFAVGIWAQGLNCPSLSGYRQQINPLTGTDLYKISFNCNTDRPIDFVDIHYRKSTGLLLNARMTPIGGNIFEFGDTGSSALRLQAGESLAYSFTYCLQMTTCDTESFSYVSVQPTPVMTTMMPSLPIIQAQQQSVLTCPVLTGYQQSVVPMEGQYGYKIVFDTQNPTLTPDWVDVHYRLNGGEYVNIRMASPLQSRTVFEARNINLQVTDSLEYFFTYCVNMVDCNTELHQFRLPQPTQAAIVELPKLECPVFNNLLQQVVPMVGESSVGYKIVFDDNTPMNPDWVDLHYKINNAEYVNVRMLLVSGKFEWPNIPSLNAGDVMNYFFTYCVNGVDCNTDIFTFNLAPPQAIVAPRLACPVLVDYTHQVPSTDSGYKIIFNPNSGLQVDWVDVHYRIGETDLVNVRMNKVGNSYEIANVPLNLGDNLSYFFTYCIGGVDCNTDILNYSLPQPQPIVAPVLVCPVLTSSLDQVIPVQGINKYKISFNANFQLPVDWVDLHYSINSGTTRNFRMTPLGNNIFEYQDYGDSTSLSLSSGDTLTYWFTYCVSMVDCDTTPKMFRA